MSTARIYARNLAANWVGHGANLAVMFFLSPFVIHTLGLPAYGLWSALNVLVGYMGVLDLGIRASTGRHVILYVGQRDQRSVDETIRTSLGFFSALGVGLFIAGVILGQLFPLLFSKVSPEHRSLLLILLPVMAVNLWVSMIRGVLSSLLSAHDRFDLARGLDLSLLVFHAIGTVVALKLGYGISGLVFVVVGCNVVGLFGIYCLAKKVYSPLRIWPLTLIRSRLRELFGYGIPAAISSAAIKIIGQTDVIIVSACISFSAAGIYSAGAKWLYYSTTLLGQIGVTFFPPLQRAVARGEMGEARWLLFRQVRLAALFGLPIFIGFIMFGQRFLYLWLYDVEKFPQQAVETAAVVMGVLGVSKLLSLLSDGPRRLLDAQGFVKFTALLAVVEAVLNLTVSLVLVIVFKFGPVGVALGTLVARLVVGTFWLPYVACRRSGIAPWRFIGSVAGSLITAGILFAAVCYFVLWCWPTDTWVSFGAQVSLVLICYVPIAVIVLLPKDDLTRLLKKVVSVLRLDSKTPADKARECN